MSNDILTYSQTGSQHTSTKERLLNAAILQLLNKSYAKMHLTEIAKACNIKQASIYHHFPNGKESIVMEIIKRTQWRFQSNIYILTTQRNIKLNDKIELVSQEIKKFLTQCNDPIVVCLLIPQFIESETIRNALKKYIQLWLKSIKGMFSAILTEKEAVEIAQHSMERFQGAILIARLLNDNSRIEIVCNDIFHQWVSTYKITSES